MDRKILLSEKDMPKAWYNVQADLPKPLAPVLHPATKKPIGPQDLAPIFPMALIGQEVSTERWIEIPPAGAGRALYLASDAAGARAEPGEETGDARAHLLQERVGQPGRQPQAEHRRRAGVLQ